MASSETMTSWDQYVALLKDKGIEGVGFYSNHEHCEWSSTIVMTPTEQKGLRTLFFKDSQELSKQGIMIGGERFIFLRKRCELVNRSIYPTFKWRTWFHKRYTDEKAKAVAVTLLMMQKFRATKFNISKDVLIDQILPEIMPQYSERVDNRPMGVFEKHYISCRKGSTHLHLTRTQQGIIVAKSKIESISPENMTHQVEKVADHLVNHGL